MDVKMKGSMDEGREGRIKDMMERRREKTKRYLSEGLGNESEEE